MGLKKDKSANKKPKKQQKEEQSNEDVKGIGGGIIKPRKKYRFKPGTVAMREIKKLEQTTHNIIPNLPFQRLVRSIASTLPYNEALKNNENGKNSKIRFRPSAIEALKSATEDYIIEILCNSNKITKNRNAKTLRTKDMYLLFDIMKTKSQNFNPDALLNSTYPIIEKNGKKHGLEENKDEKTVLIDKKNIKPKKQQMIIEEEGKILKTQ